MEHLEELRWHVVRSLVSILVFTIIAFSYGEWIFDNIIFAPGQADFPTFQWLCKLGQMVGSPEALCIDSIPFHLQSRQMTGQFTMHITASVVIGLILSFPYICWEMWRFIRPGLKKSERRYSQGAVASVSFLFLAGVLFGYYVMSPMMISFLATYQISDLVSNEFDITSFVGTIVTVVFGSGILFQLPVVIYFLTKMGIITPQFLRKSRKHAIIIILILGAIVTPSADPLSQALIALPLYLLYEIGILISSSVVRRQAKEEEEEKENEQSVE